jgi:toxin ParE1/3/4
MQVELSRFIEPDLNTIAEYIAQDSPARAVSFVSSDLEIGKDARMALAGRYAILFRIDGDAVRIERVVYGGRDLGSLLDQER